MDASTEVRTLAKLTVQVLKEIWMPATSRGQTDPVTKASALEAGSKDGKNAPTDEKPNLAPGEGKATIMRVLKLIEPEVVLSL